MRSLRTLFFSVLLILGGVATAGAQEAVAPAAVVEADAPAQEQAAGAALIRTEGVGGFAAPPRTLRPYWHVFVAFAVAWVLIFGYTLSLGRRAARIERELQAVGEAPRG